MTKNFKVKRIEDALAIGVFILFIFFGYRDLFIRKMIAIGDLPPFPENINLAFELFRSSWVPISHGTTGRPLDFLLLYQISLIFLAGGNAALAQKIYMFLPFILAFVSMYLFLRRFISSIIARSISSFVYSLNPFTIPNSIGGALGWVYIHAFFPLLIDSLFELTNKTNSNINRIKHILKFSIIFAFPFVTFGFHIILFLVPFVMYAFINVIITKHRRTILNFSLNFIAASCLIILLIFVTWAPAIVLTYQRALPGAASEESVSVSYYYLPDKMSPILDILTLQSPIVEIGWGLDPSLVIAGLMLPIFAFASLLFKETDKDSIKFKHFSALLAIGIILFIYQTFLKETYWLFRIFRFLIVLPNEGTPSLLLTFAYCSMITFTINHIVRRKPQKIMTKTNRLNDLAIKTLILILILSISILDWPVFTGDMGISLIRPAYRSYISNEFYEICDWLNNQRVEDNLFRTLWLPYSYEEVEVKTRYIDPFIFSPPLREEEIFVHSIYMYRFQVLEKLTEGKTNRLGSLLSVVGVKYIIVNLASWYKGTPRVYNNHIVGDPESFIILLDQQEDLVRIKTEEEYVIYENLKYVYHISASYEPVVINWLNGIAPSDLQISDFVELLSTISEIKNFNWDIERNPIILGNQLSSDHENILNSFKSVELFSVKNASYLKYWSEDQTSVIHKYESQFIVEKDGNYTILLPSIQDTMISLDGEQSTFIQNGDFLSLSKYLTQGTHNITITKVEKPENLVVWWDFSSSNEILLFDGVDDYIEVPNSPSLNLTKEITIETWINPQLDTNTRVICDKSFDGGLLDTFLLRLENKNLELYLYNGTQNQRFILKDIIQQGWQHVAITFDNNSIRVFHNGECILEVARVEPLNMSNFPILVGKRYGGNVPQSFKGQLDDFKIYNRALNSQEIMHNYQNQSVPITEGLVLWFQLPAGIDNDVCYDKSGYNNDGISFLTKASTIFDHSGNRNKGIIHGKSFESGVIDFMLFDGVDDYIEVPNSPSLNLTKEITIEIWINPQSESSGVLVSKYITWGENGVQFELRREENGKFQFRFISETYPTPNDILTMQKYDDNYWYHIIVTKDSQNIRIYVNNSLDSEVNSTQDMPALDTSLFVGRRGVAEPEYFKGLIQEIRIYNKTLETEEIQINKVFENVLFILIRNQNNSSNNAKSSYDITYKGTKNFFEYDISITLNDSALIVFNEPYDNKWNAYLANGSKLQHFPVFSYLNGFFLEEEGTFEIRIFYEEQTSRELLIYVWAISWASVLITIVVIKIIKGNKVKRSFAHSDV